MRDGEKPMFMRVFKFSAFAALLIAGLSFGSAPASAQCGCYVPVYQSCGCGVGFYGGYYQATYGYAGSYGVGYGGGCCAPSYGYGMAPVMAMVTAMAAPMWARSLPITIGRATGVAGSSPATDKRLQRPTLDFEAARRPTPAGRKVFMPARSRPACRRNPSDAGIGPACRGRRSSARRRRAPAHPPP
jgi:hypothetical protein